MFPSGPCTRGTCDCCSRGEDKLDSVMKDKLVSKVDQKVIIEYPQYVVMTQQKGCGSHNECCASDVDLPEGVWFKNFTEAEEYYQEMCRNINILHVSFFIELNTRDKSVQEFRSTPDPVYT